MWQYLNPLNWFFGFPIYETDIITADAAWIHFGDIYNMDEAFLLDMTLMYSSFERKYGPSWVRGFNAYHRYTVKWRCPGGIPVGLEANRVSASVVEIRSPHMLPFWKDDALESIRTQINQLRYKFNYVMVSDNDQ